MEEGDLMNTADLAEAPAGLTELEERYCEAYALLESPSYGKVGESAVLAGYTARSSAWRLMHRPHIRARVAEPQQGARQAAEGVLADLAFTRQKALEKNDYAVACRCSELAGKALGMFRDSLILDVPPGREYSEAEQAEATLLARARLMLEDSTLPEPAQGPQDGQKGSDV